MENGESAALAAARTVAASRPGAVMRVAGEVRFLLILRLRLRLAEGVGTRIRCRWRAEICVDVAAVGGGASPWFRMTRRFAGVADSRRPLVAGFGSWG